MDVTRELLVKACEELNVELGISPLIDCTLDDAILLKIVKKITHLVDAKDNLSDDVLRLLLDVGGLSEGVVDIFEMKLAYNPAEKVEQLKCTEQGVSVKSGRRRNSGKRKPHISRLEELIAECKYTSKQLVKILVSEFPDVNRDTLINYVRNSKTAD